MPILQEQKSVTRLSRKKCIFRGAHKQESKLNMMIPMLQSKLLQSIVVIPTRIFKISLLSVIFLSSVNTAASENVFSSPALEQNKKVEICYQVSIDDVHYYSKSLQSFFNDIHFSPLVTNNYISVYIVTYIKKTGPINNYGLEEGDGVTHVNSKRIKDTANLISALTKFNKSAPLELSVTKKNGAKVNYKYLFNPIFNCSNTIS